MPSISRCRKKCRIAMLISYREQCVCLLLFKWKNFHKKFEKTLHKEPHCSLWKISITMRHFLAASKNARHRNKILQRISDFIRYFRVKFHEFENFHVYFSDFNNALGVMMKYLLINIRMKMFHVYSRIFFHFILTRSPIWIWIQSSNWKIPSIGYHCSDAEKCE